MKRLVLLSILLCTATFASEPAKIPDSPKSPAAITAITKADTNRAKAKEIYDKALEDARQTELADLKQCQVQAMKNEDLDEANRIQAAIDAVIANAPPPPPKPPKLNPRAELTRRLTGTKWENLGTTLLFKEDDTVDRSDGIKGTWTAVSGSEVILKQSDGSYNLWKFDEDLTRFDATIGYMSGPWTGTRIK